MNDVVLRMRGIGKLFPGVEALAGVDFALRSGSVHAIVGENGAGKSTLMKILNGVYAPSSGSIEISGQVVTLRKPVDAQRHGIQMVYQELNLAPDLTVAENIFLGRMPHKFGFVQKKQLHAAAAARLAELGANIAPDKLTGDLSISQQQLVEIAKAYAASPRMIVLDEPTSSLSEHEAAALFAVIAKMKAAGIAIVYISHRLPEILAIADDVTVLRDGRMIVSQPIAGVTAEEMIRLMVGRDVQTIFPKVPAEIGEVVLEVSKLGDGVHCHDVSFDVRAGEILGLTGLVGAGRSEAAKAIYGLLPALSGSVKIKGAQLQLGSVETAVAAGIVYVPEDRKREGIVPSMTVRENISLAILRQLSSLAGVKSRAERKVVADYCRDFAIVPPDPERKISLLSGGNQQKAVISKCLAAKPLVLILDEPTRGVDVGAKAEIHRIIGGLAQAGVAVIIISSELPEVLGVSDRVVVLRDGYSHPVYDRTSVNEELIMALATGQQAA